MATDLASDIEYLKSLKAVRERSRIVLDRARKGSLNNFIYDESRMKETAEFVAGVISVRVSLPNCFSQIASYIIIRMNTNSRTCSETLAPTDMQRFLPMEGGSISASAASCV